eukprot:COSAG05_NODE_9653_length_610_cov_0.712329_2_plen_26_part_01
MSQAHAAHITIDSTIVLEGYRVQERR